MRCRSMIGMLLFYITTITHAQDRSPLPLVKDVERQPLVTQVQRLIEALDFLGVPLRAADRAAVDAALKEMDEAQCVLAIQKVLDDLCLVGVELKSEQEITAAPGPA